MQKLLKKLPALSMQGNMKFQDKKVFAYKERMV